MTPRLTERELAAQLERAVASVIEESARKDARIAALEQEIAILTALLAQARADAGIVLGREGQHGDA